MGTAAFTALGGVLSVIVTGGGLEEEAGPELGAPVQA